MRIKFRTTIRTVILATTLTVAGAGCFLLPPSPGIYRPIHEYAEAGNLAAVTQDLATNSGDLNLPDDAGRTPLHLAATRCRSDVVLLLIDKGAKLNVKATGGATPLHLAAQGGCADVVKLLLSKGAKVNVRDDKGLTPLDRAQEWHQTNIVSLLQQNGATQ